MRAFEATSLWELVSRSELRFYQQRDLGLDLYLTGIPGILLVLFGIASAVVFLLAIFHVIPIRRHIVALLVTLGTLAVITGTATTYWDAHHPSEFEVQFYQQRSIAGPVPQREEQWAAVIAFPLFVGVLTCAANVCGCLYMMAFWIGNRRA